MIDSLTINKSPIIIFASPRTGCSLLGDLLAEKYSNLRYFNEPLGADIEYGFIDYANTNDSYILKTMAFDLFGGLGMPMQPRIKILPGKVASDILGPNGFKIRIRRRNVINQITSNYIANMRKRFMYNKFNVAELNLVPTLSAEIIPIDIPTIQGNIEIITRRNEALDNLSVPVDVDIWYEDIDGLESKSIMKTIQPANYEEIKETIRSCL